MKILKWLILISVFILGCQDIKTKNVRGNLFKIDNLRNVSKVETHGDSLKIIIRDYGDSVIKHYIDLKGIEDDGFDNSFNVTILRKSEQTPKFKCEKSFKFKYGKFDIYYCVEELKEELRKIPFSKPLADSIGVTSKIDSLIGINKQYLLMRSFDKINYQIVERESKDTIKTILKGNYTTEFSGGIQYEIINSSNDTIYFFQENSWMR